MGALKKAVAKVLPKLSKEDAQVVKDEAAAEARYEEAVDISALPACTQAVVKAQKESK